MANKKNQRQNIARNKKTSKQTANSTPETQKKWWQKPGIIIEYGTFGILFAFATTFYLDNNKLNSENIKLNNELNSVKLSLKTEESESESTKTELKVAESERDKLQSKLNNWKFSQPLYSQIPGDIDFMSRGLKINRKEGAIITSYGPKEGDKYMLQITNIIEAAEKDYEGNKKYSFRFSINAVFDKNTISDVISEHMPLKRFTLSRPLNAMPDQFYVFVEEVTIDDVFLTVARRRAISGSTVSHNIVHGMNIGLSGEPPPPPILLDSPEN